MIADVKMGSKPPSYDQIKEYYKDMPLLAEVYKHKNKGTQ